MDKKAAASTTKPVRNRIKVQTITITPEQATNFLNRVTGALERVENMHVYQVGPDHGPATHIDLAGQRMNGPNAGVSGGNTSRPAEPLDSMILTTRDLARSVCELSGGLRARLYDNPPAPDGERCATISRGLTKDGVSQTHELLLQLQQDIMAIGNYLTA